MQDGEVHRPSDEALRVCGAVKLLGLLDIDASATNTVGFNVTSMNWPPPSDSSIMLPTG